MNHGFDEILHREGTDSVKYDLRKETFGRGDVIPMWVADTDFRSPSFITDAIRKRADHGVFGYTFRGEGYFSSLQNWNKKRHNWDTPREWIIFTPGVVPALNFCTLAFTKPGDSVIVQPPVYFPFFPAVEQHGRKILYNQLIKTEKGWETDFSNLAKLAAMRPAMIILSNPHNPVGRAWKKEELAMIADLCLEYGITIVSDEIHCDLVMPGYRHTPTAALSEKISDITVTLTAPSKTFNIAGLSTSAAIISNPELRKSFSETTGKLHVAGGNIFGNIASEAAYSNGAEWVDELTAYIASNGMLVKEFLEARVPEIIPSTLEATYLMWLDCSRLNMKPADLKSFFVEKAGVGMNEGSTFGPGGEGFMRMNIGTARSVVEKALIQIEAAVAQLR